MSQNELHPLFQHMGELLSGIRGLHDTMNIRQAQAEQLHELLRSDLATLRRDQHDLEEKLDCIILISQRDIENLRSSSNQNARAIEAALAEMAALKLPMSQMLALKSRFAGLLFAFGVLGSCALWLFEPLYKWLVDVALRGR